MPQSDEWHTVSKKQKRKTNNKMIQEKEPEPVNHSVPQPITRKPGAPRQHNRPLYDDRDKVRQSWKDETVEMALKVPPERRRHVIGTRGETIRQIRQQYPAVRVSVPLQKDFLSHDVILEGPKTQVAAVAREITSRLKVIEAQLRE